MNGVIHAEIHSSEPWSHDVVERKFWLLAVRRLHVWNSRASSPGLVSYRRFGFTAATYTARKRGPHLISIVPLCPVQRCELLVWGLKKLIHETQGSQVYVDKDGAVKRRVRPKSTIKTIVRRQQHQQHHQSAHQ